MELSGLAAAGNAEWRLGEPGNGDGAGGRDIQLKRGFAGRGTKRCRQVEMQVNMEFEFMFMASMSVGHRAAPANVFARCRRLEAIACHAAV